MSPKEHNTLVVLMRTTTSITYHSIHINATHSKLGGRRFHLLTHIQVSCTHWTRMIGYQCNSSSSGCQGDMRHWRHHSCTPTSIYSIRIRSHHPHISLFTCHNVPEPGGNRPDAVSIGPIPAVFWYIMVHFQSLHILSVQIHSTLSARIDRELATQFKKIP